MKKIYHFRKIVAGMFCAAVLCSACASANSQRTDINKTKAADADRQNTNQVKTGENKSQNTSQTLPDNYEIAKAGAEKLNAESFPPGSGYRKVKPLTREQIRQALINSQLIGESRDGLVGGGKIVHFSHTCDLFINGRPFRVINAPMIIQLASFFRYAGQVLIYDEEMKLVHNLKTDDPLFCDGNRLFFSDYELTVPSTKRDGTAIKGNVLIFSNDAKDIKGRIANLNFYRFRDLIQ